jgi:radical SAM protein with 4Fe4S-binding SPASM domain
VHAIAELRRLGFASVGISSNGLRLGQEPELLDALVQAGMDGLNLSLDGPEAYHNQVRGNAQAYAHVVSTLQRARSKHPQLGLSLTVVVSAHNFDSYQHVADIAEQYAVHTLKVVGVIPQGRAQSLDTYVLQDAQLLALLEHVQRMRTEHALGQRRCDVTFTDDGFVACFEGRVRNGLFQCPAGVSVATLWHDGRLAACPQLSLEANFQGDLRHHNFAELWQGGFAPFRKREWLKQGPCRSCPDWRYCMGGSLHDRDEQGRLLRCNALAIRRAKRDRNERP